MANPAQKAAFQYYRNAVSKKISTILLLPSNAPFMRTRSMPVTTPSAHSQVFVSSVDRSGVDGKGGLRIIGCSKAACFYVCSDISLH